MGGTLVAAYLSLLLLSSILITLVEPQGSALTHFDQALWWSIVTSTTVGYGDLFPASNAGKVVAVFLPMFMGIGLGAAFITHVASNLIERRDKRMHGEKEYTDSHHILLVGHTEETEQLVKEIQGDESYKNQEIVIIADIQRHPLPDLNHIYFVKGRPDRLDTLEKANISEADRIIIHTGSDEESLFALINALKLKSEKCEITVRCLFSQSLDTFSSVNGDFQIIIQMTAEMMVQAMQDKVHLPLQILLRNNSDEEIYYISLPKAAETHTWWSLHKHLKEKYDYLTFALQTASGQVIVNPSKDQPLAKEDGLWLMAQKRPETLDWT